MLRRITSILASLMLAAGLTVLLSAPASASTTGCASVGTPAAAVASNEIEAQEPGGGGLMTNPTGVGFHYQYLSTCDVIRINHITFTDAYSYSGGGGVDWDAVYVTQSLPTYCWVQFVDATTGAKLYDEPHKACYDGVDSSSYVTLASGLTAANAYYIILFQWGHTNSHFNFNLNSHA